MNPLSKNVLVVLPILLLAACGGNRGAAKLATHVLDDLSGNNREVSRETVAGLPDATMGLEWDFSPQVLLVLGSSVAGELSWFSDNRIFVATRQGRIVRTVGLPSDLGGSHPFALRRTASPENSYALDFPDLNIFGAPAFCRRTDWGEDSVKILGAVIPTRHVVEHCSAPALSWNFDNEYWEDRRTGYVWRSCQHVHPGSPPVLLTMFRPEAARQDAAARPTDVQTSTLPGDGGTPAATNGEGC